MNIKKYLLIALVLLLFPLTVYGLEDKMFINSWTGPKAYTENINDEMLGLAVLYYNNAPYKNGFVSTNIIIDPTNETAPTTTKLIYRNSKNLEQKEFEIGNMLSLELATSDEYVYILAQPNDEEAESFYLAQFDSELKLINHIEIEEELQSDLLLELKSFNKNILKVYENKLYLISNTNTMIEYDLHLNQLRKIEIDNNYEEVNKIFKEILILFNENETELLSSYAKKGTYEVYGGSYLDEDGDVSTPFIRLYNNNELVFEKKYDDLIAHVKSIQIKDDYMYVYFGTGSYINILYVIDFQGNMINILQDALINYNLSSNEDSIILTVIENTNQCPSYIEKSQCISICNKEYTLTEQNPEHSMAKYGGSKGDYFEDAILTKDGGYITVGYTKSDDIPNLTTDRNNAAIIVKYDKNQNIVWEKSWGGSNGDIFYSIKELQNGNYLVLGTSNSTNIPGLTNSGNYDGILVIYDKNGNVVHEYMWGGTQGEVFYDAIVKSDGSLIVLASTESKEISGLEPPTSYLDRETTVFLKFNSNYELQHQHPFKETYSSRFQKIKATSDGGFVVVGDVYNELDPATPSYYSGPNNGTIVKFDKEYNIEWSNSYFEKGSYSYYPHAFFHDFIIDKEGNYIVVGEYARDTDFHYGLVIKYDKNGKKLWDKLEIGPSLLSYPRYSAITEVVGGYLVSGNDSSIGEHVTLNFYDYNGNQKWTKQEYIDNKIKDNITIEKILAVSINKYIVLGSIRYGNLFESGTEDYDAFIYKFTSLDNVTTHHTENGTYTIEKQGDKIEIITNPNEGYEVDEIKIQDIDGNEVEFYTENNKYYFKTNKDVFVTVTYKEKKTSILDDLFNPNTGTFINIFAMLLFAISSIFIYTYVNKHKPITRI